jgi:hypothetical protein
MRTVEFAATVLGLLLSILQTEHRFWLPKSPATTGRRSCTGSCCSLMAARWSRSRRTRLTSRRAGPKADRRWKLCSFEPLTIRAST